MSFESFRFAPELFSIKSEVQELLAQHDIFWMIDYAGIDVVHDHYGIEVIGVISEDLASQIVNKLHPHMKSVLNADQEQKVCYTRSYENKSGWVVEFYREPHKKIESWLDLED